MSDHLQIKIVNGESLPDSEKRVVISLCNRAYEEDLEPLFNTFVDPTHVLGYYAGSLVSHAMWVTRWLQPANQPTVSVHGLCGDCGNRTRASAARFCGGSDEATWRSHYRFRTRRPLPCRSQSIRKTRLEVLARPIVH